MDVDHNTRLHAAVHEWAFNAPQLYSNEAAAEETRKEMMLLEIRHDLQSHQGFSVC